MPKRYCALLTLVRAVKSHWCRLDEHCTKLLTQPSWCCPPTPTQWKQFVNHILQHLLSQRSINRAVFCRELLQPLFSHPILFYHIVLPRLPEDLLRHSAWRHWVLPAAFHVAFPAPSTRSSTNRLTERYVTILEVTMVMTSCGRPVMTVFLFA